MKIGLAIELLSDLHIGSGAGRGRTVDSTVLKDENGVPYIPGSSLKGLARWHASELLKLLPELEPPAGSALGPAGVLEELFGSTAWAGSVLFADAHLLTAVTAPQVHGRSARDRVERRARDRHVFFYEDAARGTFESVIESKGDLSPWGTLLLIMALRRIEHLGGQRNRGKGHACVTVEVQEGPTPFAGLVVPGAGAQAFADLIRRSKNREGPFAADPHERVKSETQRMPPRAVKTSGRRALFVLAQAAAPLALTAQPEPGNLIQTLGYIPGTALRGAYAAHLIRAGWDPSSELFQSTFTFEEVSFGPLYPYRKGASPHTMPIPSPFSLLTCKYSPGVRNDAFTYPEPHGFHDVLAHNALATCGQSACGAPLVRLGGFLELVESTGGAFIHRAIAEKLSIQRTELDPSSLLAKEGQLYATESLPRDSWFAGYIWGPNDLLDAIVAAGPQEGEALRFYVGKGQTRGHGALDVFLYPPDAASHAAYPMLLPSTHDGGVNAAGNDTFSVTSYSDVIAIDPFLRPLGSLDDDRLWHLIGGQGAHPFSIKRGYVETRHVAGFNGAAGVPRSPDLAMAAGSTWLVGWREGVSQAQRDETHNLLIRAQTEGVGLRRGEGFGRIIVDLPLHQPSIDQTSTSARLLSVAIDAGTPWSAPPSLPLARARVQVTPPPSPIPAAISRIVDREVPEDAAGALARLLHEAAQAADPVGTLRDIAENRNVRAKRLDLDEKVEDKLIQTLLRQVPAPEADPEAERFRSMLFMCARRLAARDLANRRRQ